MANLALLVLALAAPRVAAASWPAAEAGAPPAATTGGAPSPSTLLADLRERKLVAQTCPANCGGSAHGRCVGRSCVCKGGWSGLDCTVESLLMKRCRKLRKAIKRADNAKTRKKRKKTNKKLAKVRRKLQRKGYTDATCGLADYVVTKLVAGGSVGDYDDAKRAEIAEAFAAALDGVDASDVIVVVEPYSSATTVRRAAPPSPPPAHARRPTTSLAPRRRAPTWVTPPAPSLPLLSGTTPLDLVGGDHRDGQDY